MSETAQPREAIPIERVSEIKVGDQLEAVDTPHHQKRNVVETDVIGEMVVDVETGEQALTAGVRIAHGGRSYCLSYERLATGEFKVLRRWSDIDIVHEGRPVWEQY